jgi:peroxiredoxin
MTSEDDSLNSPKPSPDSARISEAFKDQQKQSPFRLPLAAKVAILVAVFAMAAAGYYSSHGPAPGPQTAGSASGPESDADEIASRKPVPDFTLTDAGGSTKKLSDYHGNVVILSFWASWCGPCLEELPTFAEIERRFHDRGLRVLPVNVDDGDDGKAFAHDFWPKKNLPFPSFFDSTKELAQRFEIDMLPSNFVIDRQGRLAFSGFGANDWSSDQNIQFIDGLLQEK